MNAWYKFILNVLFSKKSENKDWEMTDEEEDILANYIELDSLMRSFIMQRKLSPAAKLAGPVFSIKISIAYRFCQVDGSNVFAVVQIGNGTCYF